MEPKIKSMPELRAAYPQFSEFIERMYVSWMQYLGNTKEDEQQAGASFVKNLTEIVPGELAMQHLIEFARANSAEGASYHATACWLVLVASNPDGKLPKVDSDLFIAWRDTRPMGV